MQPTNSFELKILKILKTLLKNWVHRLATCFDLKVGREVSGPQKSHVKSVENI